MILLRLAELSKSVAWLEGYQCILRLPVNCKVDGGSPIGSEVADIRLPKTNRPEGRKRNSNFDQDIFLWQLLIMMFKGFYWLVCDPFSEVCDFRQWSKDERCSQQQH